MIVKIIKGFVRRNIMGYDKNVLTAAKDEIVDIDLMRGHKLIEIGLGVEVVDETPAPAPAPVDETPSPAPAPVDKAPAPVPEDNGEYFTLDAETIGRLKNMDKDKIEAILRNYEVEVDKRHTMEKIHEELVEVVSTSLPGRIAASANILRDLIKFYTNKFGITLDAANYSKDKLSELTEDMGTLLKEALSNDDT